MTSLAHPLMRARMALDDLSTAIKNRKTNLGPGYSVQPATDKVLQKFDDLDLLVHELTDTIDKALKAEL